MKWHREAFLWYTLNRRREIVFWVELVPTDTGHEYRPYSPSGLPEPQGQWVQREPCQTLADAKKAATSPVSSPSLPS